MPTKHWAMAPGHRVVGVGDLAPTTAGSGAVCRIVARQGASTHGRDRRASPIAGRRAGLGQARAAAAEWRAGRWPTGAAGGRGRRCAAGCGVMTARKRPARPCTWHDCPLPAAATVAFELPNLLAGSRRDYCPAHTTQVCMARGTVVVDRFGPHQPALPGLGDVSTVGRPARRATRSGKGGGAQARGVRTAAPGQQTRG
jgi:hypothetical protein